MVRYWLFNIGIKLAMWACCSGFAYDHLLEAEENEKAWQRNWEKE